MNPIVPIALVAGALWYWMKKPAAATATEAEAAEPKAEDKPSARPDGFRVSPMPGLAGLSAQKAAQKAAAVEQIKASGKDPFKGAWGK